MFQPQPTPYTSFTYGVGPDITSFAFHSSPLTGVHDGGQSGGAPGPAFLYNTASQPAASFQPISSPASAAAPTQHPPHPPPHSHSGTRPPRISQLQQPPGPAASGAVAAASSSSSSSSPIPPGLSHFSRRLQHRPHSHHSRTHMRQQQRYHRHHNHNQQPYYALRSQVKMEGDMQQLSEIAAQQAAARDYKAQHQGPLVGEKTASESITDEYAKADPVYVQKTIALPQTYSHYRPIRGDGNCGWRAIAFSYFEYLVGTGDRNLIEAELARLTSTNNFLVQNGYDLSLLEDMVQETFNLLRDLASNISNPAAAMAALMTRFSDEGLDNAIIYHMRMLAGACMKSDPSPYEHFIPGDGGVQEFLQTTIELPDREIEQIGINLLVKMLLEPVGLGLEIAYLDRTPGSEVNTYRFPDNPDSQISATLCLLFRPDHYDIVYRCPPPPPSSIQVHRAADFPQLQIAPTPAISSYGPVDMAPLATLMSSFGAQGISPLAPLPQTSPLSETYSPASQSVWPMMPTFVDPLTQPPLQRPVSPTAPQPQPGMEADLDRQVRFSKYNYPGLVEDTGYSEPTFKTTAFKNSQYNKAHYNNPDFQPEEYNPNEESFERVSHKKKS